MSPDQAQQRAERLAESLEGWYPSELAWHQRQADIDLIAAELLAVQRETRELPAPSENDKRGGWSISTDYLVRIEARMKDEEQTSWEQIEKVLLTDQAIRGESHE